MLRSLADVSTILGFLLLLTQVFVPAEMIRSPWISWLLSTPTSAYNPAQPQLSTQASPAAPPQSWSQQSQSQAQPTRKPDGPFSAQPTQYPTLRKEFLGQWRYLSLDRPPMPGP